MRFLAVVDPGVVDRTVATPVGDGRQRIVWNLARHGPILQYHRRRGGDPVEATSWHAAFRLANCQANGGEVRVAVQVEIDTLSEVPQLGERGVQVQVKPQ